MLKDKRKHKDNIVLIIADCLRNDHAYDPKIMPFLNSFKDKNRFSNKSYTNAPSTHFAMPTLMTGYMPFEVTDKATINFQNENRYIPKLYKQLGYRTIGVTTNIVTSRAFGYMKYYDTYEDFWTDANSINESRKDIVRLLPHSIRQRVVDPILKKAGSLIRPPTKVKEAISGKRILNALTNLPFKQKIGNFIFLHFMEPHSPYTSDEGIIPKKEINKLNLKLITKKHKLTKDDIKKLKKLYTLECKQLDKILKKTIHFLKENLDWNKTKILITSDHGEAFNETGYMEHSSIMIDNMHHIKVPLITKEFPINNSSQYWSVDLYNLLCPRPTKKTPTYKIAVCYDSVKKIGKNVIKKYEPIGFFNLKFFTKVSSTEELPYMKSSKSLIENLSI